MNPFRLTAAALLFAAASAPGLAADGHAWLKARQAAANTADAIPSAAPARPAKDVGAPGWGDGFAAFARQRIDPCNCEPVHDWTRVPTRAYDLRGPSHRGQAVNQFGPGFDTDKVRRITADFRPGFGQNLRGGVWSADRGTMVISFGGTRRDTIGVHEASIAIKDAGDQRGSAGNPNPRPNWRVVFTNHVGDVIAEHRFRGTTTKRGNGKVRVVGFEHPDPQGGYSYAEARITVGPGKKFSGAASPRDRAANQERRANREARQASRREGGGKARR